MDPASHTPPARCNDESPLLNIVHLEDNIHDREFVRRALLRAGLRCDFRYAETRDEFHAALARGGCSLILSDFTLPGYGGTEALAYAREHYPEVPYIFVSGTIGEERAVEGLKGGAIDYVLKNNLARLPAAVEQATRGARESARRRQAEAALRESEKRFREMAENIHDVFWISSPDGTQLLYVSPGYVRIWGRPVAELHEQPDLWINSIVEEERERVLKALASLAKGGDVRIEYRIRRPDGSVRWVETRAYPSVDAGGAAHAVGVSTDVTERKHLQQQLLQSQKMEAIGQLAGGIAHDFNNLLTVINGYTSLTLACEDTPKNLKRPLQQIHAAGERAASLTRQLLVFSRQQPMQFRPIDLNRTIDESMKMLSRVIGEQVELRLALAADLPRIEADTGMIEQVLMNLVVNARDAMPSGGRVVIGTCVREIGAAELKTSPGKRAGTFVCLSVEDTGSGIAPEIIPRIFEPFFTTKGLGQGTGLGLAMVFGIVENHQGWLQIESRVGEGSRFHVFFPATAALPPVLDPVSPDVSAARGTETILLVEDDAQVRELTLTVLRSYGYEVLTASTGVEAIELWRANEERIRLLLTDVVMPDAMTGLELAQVLRAAKTSLKVICMSGYHQTALGQKMPVDSTMVFVQKPCPPQTLARVVRETLDRV